MESTALPPASFDVNVTDISEAVLADLRHHFGFTRLSPLASPSDARFPARGVVYGVNRRVFVPLAVRHASGEPLRVFFLVDTGAPSTFLREDTLRALGLSTHGLSIAPNVFINDIKISVGLSHGHFASVDLLGADFLFRAQTTVTIDYAALECLINETAATAGGAT